MPSSVLLPSSTLHTRHETDGGRITIVLDGDAGDYHVDASPGYSSRRLGSLLRHLDTMGFEPLPEDECEAEILVDGSVRIYLVSVLSTIAEERQLA